MTNTEDLHALSGAYIYASDGSIRSHKGRNYVYPPATNPRPHAPTSVGGQAFQYDANGNMELGFGNKRMFWDAEDRLTRVIDDGITTDYVYGADGERLKRTEDGETTLTIGPIEVRDYKGPRESLVSYPHPSLRIQGGQISYLHTDHLGSLRAVTNAAGARIELRVYRGYGQMTTFSSNTLPQEDHAWLGERYDAGAELMYLNARYHDPELGMFVSPDWFDVTIPGVGTNRYAYAGGDPINNMDPGGNVLFQASDGSQTYFSPDSNEHRGLMQDGPAGAEFAASLTAGYSVDSGLSQAQWIESTRNGRGLITMGSRSLPAPAPPQPPFPLEVFDPVPLFDAPGQAIGSLANELFGQRTLVTYKLRHRTENMFYYGRASGFGTARQVAMARYAGHHRRAEYGPPKIDVAILASGLGWRRSRAYNGIRGREQQLVDQHPEGVRNENVGNIRNPISPMNPDRQLFLNTATAVFGSVPLTPY